MKAGGNRSVKMSVAMALLSRSIQLSVSKLESRKRTRNKGGDAERRERQAPRNRNRARGSRPISNKSQTISLLDLFPDSTNFSSLQLPLRHEYRHTSPTGQGGNGFEHSHRVNRLLQPLHPRSKRSPSCRRRSGQTPKTMYE